MAIELESHLIQTDAINSPEKLASVVTSVWARENQDFYLTLFSRCNKVAGPKLSQLVDGVLQEETKAIAAEILEDSHSRDGWRQWLGWINLLQLLSMGFDPLKMPRVEDKAFITVDG